MVRSRLVHPIFSLALLCTAILCPAQTTGSPAPQNDDPSAASLQDSRYTTIEWTTIAPHLPDLKTASVDKLQMAGDVLRARRFPDEAIQYYRAAMDRGGDRAVLLNRIGVAELARSQPAAARLYFRQVTLLKKKFAEGWNNLGATEDMTGNYGAAIVDYQKAVKLNRKSAMFHANLGTAYFATSDYESGRHEYQVALKLDHDIFHLAGLGGTLVQVLTTNNRGRYAFEMARVAAGSGDEAEMLHWLAVSAEAGFAVGEYISNAKEFQSYVKDARIKLILQNAKAMRAKQVATAAPAPLLPAATPTRTRD